MKILFAVNWYTPKSQDVFEAGVFHYEQAMELNKYVDVRLYWPMEPEADGLVCNNEKGLITYRSPYKQNENKLKWFFHSRKHLGTILDEFKPNIVHANVAYPCGLLCILEAKKRNIPVILTEHAPIEQMNLDNAVRRKMRHWVYKNCKNNICVSKDSMERLSEYYPDIDFTINYNAVENPNSVGDDGVKYRIDGAINCAIVASFYDKDIKGYQFLLPAIKRVVDDGLNIYLHICGGGIYYEHYLAMAKELGIGDRCFFYGKCNRQKVYSVVRQMDFCISASVFECSGVSVQEEMLIGKPILVTRSGGANSLTTDFTAIVVDRKSVDALVEGLKRMSIKYSQFDKKRIVDYAFENFEISNVTKRYMEYYKKYVK